VADELLAKGHVARAFLGISALAVAVAQVPRAPTARQARASDHSLLRAVRRAGRGAGRDIVVDVADRRAASLPDLRYSLASHIERTCGFADRGGLPAEVVLTVGQWPTEARACLKTGWRTVQCALRSPSSSPLVLAGLRMGCSGAATLNRERAKFAG